MVGFSINNPTMDDICAILRTTRFVFVWIVIDKFGNSNIATFNKSVIQQYFNPDNLDGSQESIYNEACRIADDCEVVVISDVVTAYPRTCISRYTMATLTRYTNAANFSKIRIIQDSFLHEISTTNYETFLEMIQNARSDNFSNDRVFEFIEELDLEKNCMCVLQRCPYKSIPKMTIPLHI